MFQTLGKQQIKFYSWANIAERTANLFYCSFVFRSGYGRTNYARRLTAGWCTCPLPQSPPRCGRDVVIALLPRRRVMLPLVASSVQILDHARQTDVQKPDLAVQVVDFLLQSVVAVPPPVEAHGTRHEVDGDHEAEGKDGVFGLALVFLKDVDAGQSEEDDTDDPEETPAQDVQKIEEESKEKRHEPISQQDGADQQKGPSWIVGEGGVAEIMGQVGSWKKKSKQKTSTLTPPT